MKAPCKTCDRRTATHRATNPRETDPKHRTWRICGSCIRQAVRYGIDLDYQELDQENN